jgi:hypothetical protein
MCTSIENDCTYDYVVGFRNSIERAFYPEAKVDDAPIPWFYGKERQSEPRLLVAQTLRQRSRNRYWRQRKYGDRTMTVKTIVTAIALLLSATSATLAQSAYTTGTIASSEAAGYGSPYGGLYDYAPGHVSGHAVWAHRR